jgi:hypothetical protein
LSADERQALIVAIRNSEPRLLVNRFATEVATSSGIDTRVVENIVSMFVGMYLAMVESGAARDQFVSDLAEAFQRGRVSVEKQVDMNELRTGMQEVLACNDTLGLTAKALDLVNDHEHAFCSVRIISDVRHIFGADPHDRPKAALIVHMLNLVYHEIGKTNEMYFAMDVSDLKNLKSAIERAETKAANLKAMLAESNIKLLGE